MSFLLSSLSVFIHLFIHYAQCNGPQKENVQLWGNSGSLQRQLSVCLYFPPSNFIWKKTTPMASGMMSRWSTTYIHKRPFSAFNYFVHKWTFLNLNASRNIEALKTSLTRSHKEEVEKWIRYSHRENIRHVSCHHKCTGCQSTQKKIYLVWRQKAEDPRQQEEECSHSWNRLWKNRPSTHLSLSVAKPCPTLCDPMDCGMPGSSVLTVPWSLQYTHWSLKKASCAYPEVSEKIWMWCIHPALKVEARHGNGRRLEHFKMKEQHGQKCGGRRQNENKRGTGGSSVWPEDGGSGRRAWKRLSEIQRLKCRSLDLGNGSHSVINIQEREVYFSESVWRHTQN